MEDDLDGLENEATVHNQKLKDLQGRDVLTFYGFLRFSYTN